MCAALLSKKSVSFHQAVKSATSIGRSSSNDSSGNANDENAPREATSSSSSLLLINREEILRLLQMFFDDYNDEDFVRAIVQLTKELEHLTIENEVFIWSLEEYEPELLTTLDYAKEKVVNLQMYNPLMPLYFRRSIDTDNDIENEEEAPFTEGEKVNVSTRTDLAVRYSDEIQRRLEEFVANNCALRKHYENEIEEAEVRMRESIEGLYAFEMNVVIGGMDENTRRVPAELFVLYMREWMTSAGTVTEKIRLNIASLKVVYAKLKQQYGTKLELGAEVHEIDYEQLRTENKHLRSVYDAKAVSIVEMKHMKALFELQLAVGKSHLIALNGFTAKMIEMKKDVERETRIFVEEVEETRRDITLALHELRKVQRLAANCSAPTPLEYLRTLRQLAMEEKRHKVLLRKERLVQISRDTYEVNMLRLTRRKNVDPTWYEPLFDDDDDEMLYKTSSLKIVPEFDLFKALKIVPEPSRVRILSG